MNLQGRPVNLRKYTVFSTKKEHPRVLFFMLSIVFGNFGETCYRLCIVLLDRKCIHCGYTVAGIITVSVVESLTLEPVLVLIGDILEDSHCIRDGHLAICVGVTIHNDVFGILG